MGVGVNRTGVGAGVGVCKGLTSVGVDAPTVVVAVVVAAGSVFVGSAVAVGALVIVGGRVLVGGTGVPVEEAVGVAGITVLVTAVRDATGEGDEAGLEGLAEAAVGELMDGLRVAAGPGGVMTTVGADATVFVAAGNAGALAVTTVLGMGVTSGAAGIALEGLILESWSCTVDLAALDAITARRICGLTSPGLFSCSTARETS